MQYLDAISKTTEWSLFISKANHYITVIQVYALTSNVEEAEVERFYDDLEDLLELTAKKDVLFIIGSDQIRSVTQSCPTLCNPMNRSTPGLPVQHQFPEFTETHVHRVSDAIQPSHPPLSPSPPAPNPSQHQSLFQWVNWCTISWFTIFKGYILFIVIIRYLL